jgi:hypothetical protein
MSHSTLPDTWLSEMTDGGRFEIGWWLRWENLGGDFLEFASQYTHVNEEKRAHIFHLGRINERHYDHEVSHWFSEEQIARLYENNPIWATAEQQAYDRRRALDSAILAAPVDTATS